MNSEKPEKPKWFHSEWFMFATDALMFLLGALILWTADGKMRAGWGGALMGCGVTFLALRYIWVYPSSKTIDKYHEKVRESAETLISANEAMKSLVEENRLLREEHLKRLVDKDQDKSQSN